MGSTDRDNMLRLSASRFSASRFSASRCMQNQRWFGAKQSEAFASMMEEELDTGITRDPARTRNMDFLKLAFEEFGVALQSLNVSAVAADEAIWLVSIWNARNNKDGIQLDEWMDNMPESLLQKLGDHAKAEAWRRMIEPVEQRQ